MTMSENRHRCADEEVKERKMTMSANRHRRLATKSPHFRHQAQRVILVTKSPALRPLRVTAVTLMLWVVLVSVINDGRDIAWDLDLRA